MRWARGGYRGILGQSSDLRVDRSHLVFAAGFVKRLDQLSCPRRHHVEAEPRHRDVDAAAPAPFKPMRRSSRDRPSSRAPDSAWARSCITQAGRSRPGSERRHRPGARAGRALPAEPSEGDGRSAPAEARSHYTGQAPHARLASRRCPFRNLRNSSAREREGHLPRGARHPISVVPPQVPIMSRCHRLGEL